MVRKSPMNFAGSPQAVSMILGIWHSMHGVFIEACMATFWFFAFSKWQLMHAVRVVGSLASPSCFTPSCDRDIERSRGRHVCPGIDLDIDRDARSSHSWFPPGLPRSAGGICHRPPNRDRFSFQSPGVAGVQTTWAWHSSQRTPGCAQVPTMPGRSS